MRYEDQIEFKRRKFREWFRLNPESRKAKRRPSNDRIENLQLLIRLDAQRLRLELQKGTFEILGSRSYRLNLEKFNH